jgi:hypothetical protein
MYDIVRFYEGDHDTEVIERSVTLAEAQEHCRDPETSSETATGAEAAARTAAYGRWFDGYQSH